MDIADGTIALPDNEAHADMSSNGSSERTPPKIANPEIHPRLQAVAVAARFYGIELDPNEFRRDASEAAPAAAALSALGAGCRDVVARRAHALAALASLARYRTGGAAVH